MNKRLCDKCGNEIKCGIRLDSNEVYPNFFKIEVHEYTGEGRGFTQENYDLCNSCYSKFVKFLKEE